MLVAPLSWWAGLAGIPPPCGIRPAARWLPTRLRQSCPWTSVVERRERCPAAETSPPLPCSPRSRTSVLLFRDLHLFGGELVAIHGENPSPPTTALAMSPSASSNGNSRASTRRSIPTCSSSTSGMSPSRTLLRSLPTSLSGSQATSLTQCTQSAPVERAACASRRSAVHKGAFNCSATTRYCAS